MLYFGLYVQLRRGSVAGYTTDESWAYGPKEGVEAFESITFFIRFIYAINFEHLLIIKRWLLTRCGLDVCQNNEEGVKIVLKLFAQTAESLYLCIVKRLIDCLG